MFHKMFFFFGVFCIDLVLYVFKCFTTLILYRKCATIKKGMMEAPNERFSINPKGFFLFASHDDKQMPGINVRYVALKTKTYDASVKTEKEQ